MYRKELKFRLFGFSIMPDHFHGLFWFEVEEQEMLTSPRRQGKTASTRIGVGSGLSRTNMIVQQDEPAATLEKREIEYPHNNYNLLSKDAPLNISKIMHRIKGKTAIDIRNELQINFKWQKYFYDFNIYTQKKYLEKLNYIHNNQYKDKRITNPDVYPYSSMIFLETGKGVFKIDEIDL